MNDINDLRSSLFDVLQKVKSGEMDIAVAKAVNETAQTIINTAKVELDFIKETGVQASKFLADAPQQSNGSDHRRNRLL